MDNSIIKENEHHPAADEAMLYIKGLGTENLFRYRESFSSCAISGNRLAEICSGTLQRLYNNEPVSDRYLLGLAWTLKSMEKNDE